MGSVLTVPPRPYSPWPIEKSPPPDAVTTGAALGGSDIVVGALIVLLLTALYVVALYWVDRHEKEPGSVLAAALLGGAVAAPVLTVLVERLAGIRMSVYPAAFHALNAAFFGGPNPAGAFVEEGAKALVLLLLFRALPREFDGVLDGVVYGGVVGAGFALAESAVYLWDLARAGSFAGVGTGLFFGVLVTGLTHCAFSAVFGASLGAVREFGLEGSSAWWLPVGGFFAAALYHAAYDALAALRVSGMGPAGLVSLARTVADWLGVMVLAVTILWALRREREIFRSYLPAEAAEGHVPREYVDAAVQGRWGSIPKVVRQPLAELAFARRRLERGLANEAELELYRNRIREATR